MFDARQQSAKDWSEGESCKRDGGGGDDDPEQEGMPFPEPKLAGESHWVFVGGVEELAG